ncbi:hypothetical protein CFP65_6917 [Kitasatospora sp. MMS16-BH015]|uniref:hypothetical protein n=1 Tax=Kitasatospora sp. MMS16-BH015 TaxID=2018025 RepID=UPI000CA3C682|nr:hypothetical protein [Kitasatospora sp. MMS16-BH015]AUG81538.1 hypothetical protein CFP65_6917 [Kitasatospora sp. MMS16-BH015]
MDAQVAAGLLAPAALQRLLAVRFRRLVNVPLAVATLVVPGALVSALVLVAAGARPRRREYA